MEAGSGEVISRMTMETIEAVAGPSLVVDLNVGLRHGICTH